MENQVLGEVGRHSGEQKRDGPWPWVWGLGVLQYYESDVKQINWQINTIKIWDMCYKEKEQRENRGVQFWVGGIGKLSRGKIFWARIWKFNRSQPVKKKREDALDRGYSICKGPEVRKALKETVHVNAWGWVEEIGDEATGVNRGGLCFVGGGV